jgi:hypothetical protein
MVVPIPLVDEWGHILLQNLFALLKGCKQSKVDGSLLLLKKKTCSHEKVIMYWKQKIIIGAIINMKITFFILYFYVEKPHLENKLNRIFKNISTCTKCSILQNGLHVDEILIF